MGSEDQKEGKKENWVSLANTHWNTSVASIREYFKEHEDIIKLAGVNIAIVGLLLNLKSEDIYLRRIETFFLLTICILITWFVIKSLLKLFKGRLTDLYYSLIIVLVYVGVTLISNLWKYVVHNFYGELLFYLHIIAPAIIAVMANLAYIGTLKLIRKLVGNVKGSEIRIFFLLTLNFQLILAYGLNDNSFRKTINYLTQFNFNNLIIIYCFFLAILSEMHPYEGKTRKYINRQTLGMLFLIGLPFLIKYLFINQFI